MKSERWNEIDEILQSVLERPSAEREAYLAEVCAGDEELRREVATLMTSHEHAGSFMAAPALQGSGDIFEAEPKLKDGDSVGPYRITKPIGRGGMGEVYLAVHTAQSREVALKILPQHFLSDEQRVLRFRREAQAVLALNHPNVLTVYDIGEAAGVQYISTELVEGETLRQRMRNARLTIEEAVDIAVQIAGALAYAHEKGVIHRDVKPENIMLRPDGYVKVLDFGIAKLIERQAPSVTNNVNEAPTRMKNSTTPGMVMGTADYMSPEQARGLPVDERTDTWSLGVILYEMLCGHRPFEGETPSDVISLILQRAPKQFSTLLPGAPPEIEQIVSKALSKSKDERYQTAKDFQADLRRFKRHYDHESEIDSSTSPGGTGNVDGASTDGHGSGTTMRSASPTASSAEYKLGATLLLAGLVLAITGLFYFSRYGGDGKTAVNSLAVLPFTNASGDVNTEYLADGISESLINSLSQLPRLKVIARSSVFTYKGKEIDIQRVANALGVQAIVTGRVVQRGDNLQISVEMVDASDKTLMWGNQYNRKAVDLQAVQEEIAREISERLRFRLTGEEQKRVTKHYTDNPEAYKLYLEGRFYWGKRTDEGLKKSIDYFNRAIKVDPNYALAYTGLANSYSFLGTLYLLSPKEAFARATVVAGRALEIDDQLAEARLSLAIIKFFYEWNWAEGEKECQEAIRLNPNLAQAHYVYAQYFALAGRFDDAIREARRSQELDPLAGDINTTAGWIYYFARRTDEAMKEYNRVIEIDPNFFRAHRLLGLCYLQKNRPEEAIAEMQKSVALSENSPEEIAYLGYAYAVLGRRDEARKVIEKLNTLANEKYVSPYLMALIYTGLDERDQAIGWLEKSYEARSSNMMFLKVDPKFDNIRSDPKFQDIERRVGLRQ